MGIGFEPRCVAARHISRGRRKRGRNESIIHQIFNEFCPRVAPPPLSESSCYPMIVFEVNNVLRSHDHPDRLLRKISGWTVSSYIKFVNLRILSIQNCEMYRQGIVT